MKSCAGNWTVIHSIFYHVLYLSLLTGISSWETSEFTSPLSTDNSRIWPASEVNNFPSLVLLLGSIQFWRHNKRCWQSISHHMIHDGRWRSRVQGFKGSPSWPTLNASTLFPPTSKPLSLTYYNCLFCQSIHPHWTIPTIFLPCRFL